MLVNDWHNTEVILWADDSVTIITYEAGPSTGALNLHSINIYDTLTELLTITNGTETGQQSLSDHEPLMHRIIEQTGAHAYTAVLTITEPAKDTADTFWHNENDMRRSKQLAQKPTAGQQNNE